MRAVARYAPDLKGAEFGDASFEPHRYNRSLLAIQFERDLQRAEFLNIGTPIFQQAAGMVLLTDTGTQETKLGWFADDEAKLAAGNRGFGALLHPKGNNAERLERSLHAGHRRHGAFNSDVIGTRGSTSYTHAATATRLPVIGRASRNCVLQVRGFEDLLCPQRVESFLSQPAVQHFDHTVAQYRRLHHSAVEQDVRGACQSAGAAPDACRLGTITNLLRQKPRKVPGDGWIGRIRQAQFLKANAALPRR